MKKMVCMAMLAVSALSFAQKKEIDRAFSALESNNTSGAATELAAAESAVNNKLYLLEPEIQEKYYYTKGMLLIRQGNALEGAKYLSKIGEMAKESVYYGKDQQRNKVYFPGKKAAAESGLTDLKEKKYQPATLNQIANSLNELIQKSNQSAVNAYNSKDYSRAGDDFAKVYYLMAATGNDGRQQLYNAGISYVLAGKHDKGAEVFEQLIDSNYTGQETMYLAKNKKSGQVERMNKEQFELFKKMGAQSDYTDFKVETTPNEEENLYEAYAGALDNMKQYDKLITFSEKALKKFPKNDRLVNVRSMAYYKAGKEDMFIKTLQEQVQQNPSDKTAWYNLGVMLSKDQKNTAKAKEAFEKALSLDPKYTEAWQNLTFMMMGDDEAAVAEYKRLGDAKKFDEANKVMEARKERFKNALSYAEKWHQADPQDKAVVTLLKGMYSQLKMNDKAKQMAELEAKMK